MFLIYVLFLHWLADFICQTDWMALNKNSDFQALASHVATYAVVLTGGVFLTARFPFMSVILFSIVNYLVHLITDFFTSKLSSHMKKLGKNREFFWVFGFDQFIHAATLVLTTSFLLGVS